MAHFTRSVVMNAEQFLTNEQEQKVIASIIEAEKNTSGEIRVHLESSHKEDPIKRAQELFHELGMDRTELKNGVLFYVAVDDHKFAIIGDKGIDEKVPDDFWESIKNEVIGEFAHENYDKGLIMGILHCGEKLKNFFPYTDKDKNELSDEISKGQ